MTAFLASLVVRDRACLVVGGDAEAAEKSARLAAAGGRVTVLAPEVVDGLRELHARGVVRWLPRGFDAALDLSPPPFVVISTILDDGFSADLQGRARAVGAIVCCVDQPARCDFFHTAQGDVGGITLGFASDGRAPALAKRLRDELVAALDGPLRPLVAGLVTLRAATPRDARRARMAEALRGFGIEVRVTLPPWVRGDR